ncbi:2-C-methyl-D-erythritol 4-phosphate cytidylyltransferase [Microbulbifer bruguierae]|uniref:2-C-methyl-D-erythritol 4-phosphate cytidylyltransferase n=1 Tax=Microbulbifer bruguierae TaxID=3029061 RepID=A0ABY8NGX7_9GAMM|nr:2-C-methyl-D-erythritol 4-phosphate cytidylyltransferase [Microbulbifer bruguierae]WGL17619.1 2-C-methyl-D-erythritol 4-phosphate cytidylyltransferase [Microbulbifer bruguierae]
MTSSQNLTPRPEDGFWAVVPAAGSGKRMGADKPKQYLTLAGIPLIAQTLNNILSWPRLAGIVVAIAADDTEFQKLPQASNPKVHTVAGGKERADSVLAALDYLSGVAAPDTTVLVHDAARPLVKPADIEKLLAAAPTALLAQPASDTIKQATSAEGQARVKHTLPREEIWLAQTPQKAPLELLRKCLRRGMSKSPALITDEASALELAGYQPELVAACRSNFKVTHPADLILAEALLQYQSEQIQSGTET